MFNPYVFSIIIIYHNRKMKFRTSDVARVCNLPGSLGKTKYLPWSGKFIRDKENMVDGFPISDNGTFKGTVLCRWPPNICISRIGNYVTQGINFSDLSNTIVFGAKYHVVRKILSNNRFWKISENRKQGNFLL